MLNQRHKTVVRRHRPRHQLVGKTLSLDLPPGSGSRRPPSALRRENSVPGLSRHAPRLNTLDAVSTLYKLPGAALRSATPLSGARRTSTGSNFRTRLEAGPGVASHRSGIHGAKAEVLRSLMGLESMAREDRVQACRDVLVHLAAHEPDYKEILDRVHHEYEDTCAALRLETTALKKSVASLQTQHQQAIQSVEELRRENHKLRLAGERAAEATVQLQAETERLMKQHEAAQQRLASLEKRGQAVAAHTNETAGSNIGPEESSSTQAPGHVAVAATASRTESEVLEGVQAVSAEEALEYALQLGMGMPEDHDLLWLAEECLRDPLPLAWKACVSPEGDMYYFNFENGASLWDRPDLDKHRNRLAQERARLKGRPVHGAPSGDEVDTDSESDDEAETDLSHEGGIKLPDKPVPALPRPPGVPALDFTLMAKLLEEQENAERNEQEEAAAEAAKLASQPLPEGWSVALSRSTGQPYYVNGATGATQYDFPQKQAEAWEAFGAMHLYGGKGIAEKPARRNSL